MPRAEVSNRGRYPLEFRRSVKMGQHSGASAPGRRSAVSRMSSRLVAMTTLIWLVASKPSNWLRSSSIVRCTSESPPDSPSCAHACSELKSTPGKQNDQDCHAMLAGSTQHTCRCPPIESISSIKMIEGACSRAITKSSRTMREPSPMYFCTSSEPDTRMNVHSV